MTKKRLVSAAVVAICLSLCAALAACGNGTVFTVSPFGGDITFEDLNEEVDGPMDLSIMDGVAEVELTSGTVDLVIYDNAAYTSDDTDIYVEGNLLKEAKGLHNGDKIYYNDDDGAIVVHITGYDATGKITFSAK